jgi:cell division protein FtsL
MIVLGGQAKTKMTYSQSLSIQKNQVYRRGQNTYSIARSTAKVGPVSTAVIVLTLVCLLGIVYLSQVTRTNTLGYSVSSLQQKESDLKKEKADLDVEAVRLQSIEKIKSSQVAGALTAVKPSAYAN